MLEKIRTVIVNRGNLFSILLGIVFLAIGIALFALRANSVENVVDENFFLVVLGFFAFLCGLIVFLCNTVYNFCVLVRNESTNEKKNNIAYLIISLIGIVICSILFLFLQAANS